MKKRIVSLFLMLVMLTSVIGTCYAENPVSSFNCQYTGSKTEGGTKTFYVKANNDGTCQLKFTCGKGRLDWYGGDVCYSPQYGSYEVKIYDGNEQIKRQDIYHRGEMTISFSAEKNKVYKIDVWNWKPRTIALSYFNHGFIENVAIGAAVGQNGTPKWNQFPSITVKNKSNCTLYKKKP